MGDKGRVINELAEFSMNCFIENADSVFVRDGKWGDFERGTARGMAILKYGVCCLVLIRLVVHYGGGG